MAAVATTSLFTPLLILLLLESPPSIMADPPSSDESPSNVVTPATNISPAVATICLVSVCFFFLSGFFFVALRWIMEAGWCGFRSGGPSLGAEEGPQRDPLPHGLAQEAASPPTYLYKDVKMHRQVGDGELECAVCLSEFEDHEALRRLPKCSHVFHPHCVDPWLVSQVTCPVCRAVLTPSKSNHSHRFSSSEAEASGDHVLTIDGHNSPLRPALDHSRPSPPDLTTEDSAVDRDQQFTLTLPTEEAANAMWQVPSARRFHGVVQSV